MCGVCVYIYISSATWGEKGSCVLYRLCCSHAAWPWSHSYISSRLWWLQSFNMHLIKLQGKFCLYYLWGKQDRWLLHCSFVGRHSPLLDPSKLSKGKKGPDPCPAVKDCHLLQTSACSPGRDTLNRTLPGHTPNYSLIVSGCYCPSTETQQLTVCVCLVDCKYPLWVCVNLGCKQRHCNKYRLILEREGSALSHMALTVVWLICAVSAPPHT